MATWLRNGDLDRAIVLRRHAATSELRPYESLETSARGVSTWFRNLVEEIFTTGYTRDGYNLPSVYPPFDWFAHHRSFAFHLHAWDGITDLITWYSLTGEARCLEAAMAYARDWIAKFQVPRLGTDGPDELDALVRPHMPSEWYDMAVGQRSYRMAYLLDLLIRDPDSDDEEIALWWRTLQFHLKLLNREHFFRSHSNHGLYQALGHMAAARRFLHMPGMDREYAIGHGRMLTVLGAHFSIEGPHKEHSPGYHYMLLGTLTNARRSGLLDDSDFASRMARIESALPHMVKPDFCLATIGDTDPRHLARGEAIANLYRDEHLRFVLSNGKVGSPLPAGVQQYLESGYAFARLYSPDVEPVPANASYLAQIAGFHSRVHKHSDHLSFVWFDRHRDVLTDPGRYAYAGKTDVGSELFEEGFWYADPKRIYCETTRAHNCLEIDGRNYQRNKVKPFGSALLLASEQDGMAVTDCAATHLKTVRHRRHLIVRPGHFLLVLDWVYDRSGQPHDYRQWFHLAPPWQAKNLDGAVKAVHPGAGKLPPLCLRVASLVPDVRAGPIIRGQEQPKLLGWVSDKPHSLVPTSCFSLAQSTSEPATFATLFSFGDMLIPDWNTTRFNATMKFGQAAWTDELGTHKVNIDRQDDRPLTVGYLRLSGPQR